MALAPDDITAIEGLLGSAAGEPGAVEAVRAQFPGLSMTRCDQSDVDAEDPFRSMRRSTSISWMAAIIAGI